MHHMKTKPVIRKVGTIDTDMVETTPLVLDGRLYRFEYVRQQYPGNKEGTAYFRLKDCLTGACTPPFAYNHHLGSAYAEDGKVYAYGIDERWGRDTINVFVSGDLKNWEKRTALKLPGWELYNTSVCKGRDGYVMALEIGAPKEECGVPFTIRFAVSQDLVHWTLTSSDCVFSKDRYTACPVIRYLSDEYYYMVYLEALPGRAYAPYIARSWDLAHWELSMVNPFIMYDDAEDKKLGSAALTSEQRDAIYGALNVNNSDVDLCEYNGRTVIFYCWGDQMGTEFLAEAVYDGPMEELLKGFFDQWEPPVMKEV